MKNFIKGFRFTPSNYPAEVEAKIQKYRKQGYKLPPRKVLRTPEQLEGIRESAKSILHCWTIFQKIFAKECLLKRLMYWYMISPPATVLSLPHSTTKDFLKVYAQALTTWFVTVFPTK